MESENSFSSDPFEKLIVQELEGLIKLAEECVNKIDSLTAAIDKVRVYFSVILMLSILMLGACLGFMYDVNKTNVTFFNATPVVFLLLLLACSLILGMSWAVASGRSRYRSLKRELFAERDVHDRLITLIHEQSQRVAHRRAVTPVTFAMLEIRIRRLMR